MYWHYETANGVGVFCLVLFFCLYFWDRISYFLILLGMGMCAFNLSTQEAEVLWENIDYWIYFYWGRQSSVNLRSAWFTQWDCLKRKQKMISYSYPMFMSICLHTNLCTMCAHHSWRLEEGTGPPGTRVTDGYKLAVGAGNQARVL